MNLRELELSAVDNSAPSLRHDDWQLITSTSDGDSSSDGFMGEGEDGYMAAAYDVATAACGLVVEVLARAGIDPAELSEIETVTRVPPLSGRVNA